MTYDKVKAMLESYIDINRKIEDLLDNLKDIKAEQKSVYDRMGSPIIDGLPHGTDTSDPTLNKVTELEIWQNRRLEVAKNICTLDKERNTIYDMILTLTGDEYRVIHERYVKGCTMEAVAIEMNYTKRNCDKIKCKAIKRLTEVKK